MTGKRLLLLALAVLVVFAAACKPKPPTPPSNDLETNVTTLDPEPVDVTPAPTPAPSDDVMEEDWPDDVREATNKAYREGLLGEVFFDFDSSSLSSDARDRLSRNANFFKDHPEYAVTVEGHCDERGTNEYNIALGDRRSNTALDYLSSLGVPGGRFKTVSFGEERSVCNAGSEDCWQRNRRAYFRLTGKM